MYVCLFSSWQLHVCVYTVFICFIVWFLHMWLHVLVSSVQALRSIFSSTCLIWSQLDNLKAVQTKWSTVLLVQMMRFTKNACSQTHTHKSTWLQIPHNSVAKSHYPLVTHQSSRPVTPIHTQIKVLLARRSLMLFDRFWCESATR